MEYEWERERETGDWERVGRDGENDIGKRERGMWGRLYEGNGQSLKLEEIGLWGDKDRKIEGDSAILI